MFLGSIALVELVVVTSQAFLPLTCTEPTFSQEVYYNKLNDSPASYAAVVLHPRYRNYCKVAWGNHQAQWIAAEASFQQLWRLYKRRPTPRSSLRPTHTFTNVIDDAINAIVEAESDEEEYYTDEFERWRANEPRWSREDFDTQGNPVRDWLSQRSKYPALSQLAIDIMTIPASNCECE